MRPRSDEIAHLLSHLDARGQEILKSWLKNTTEAEQHLAQLRRQVVDEGGNTLSSIGGEARPAYGEVESDATDPDMASNTADGTKPRQPSQLVAKSHRKLAVKGSMKTQYRG